MKKHIFTLLVLLACAIYPVRAYEYFTIYFSDGTKSEAFYATDVDSICYSKLSLDSIAYDDWQVQAIYTCDSVYRYPLAQIDSLSFKDVDLNKVAEEIASVSTFVNPLYLQCSSSLELAQQLESLDKVEDVEKVWTDNQSVFVKLRDWGVITYSYPPHNTPVLNRNNSRTFPNKIMSRRSQDYSESITHKHATVNNVCVITQMRKDKEFEESVVTSDSIIKMCKEWGYNVTVNNDLRPEFFIKDIKQYDLVFLMTHGAYTGRHWLLTNEEIYSQTLDKPVNEDSLYIVAKNYIKTKYLDKGYSPNDITFSPQIENRNGKRTLICYTRISNSFISKHKTPKSNNIVVFNTACQSMMGNNPEMADAFITTGATCYTGFTESNSIGPWTNWMMCEFLLNGLSIYGAYNTLPEDYYKETVELPENSGKFVYPELILWPENKARTSICITHPETLPAEISSNEGGAIIKLKGRFKVWNPEIHANAGNVGILYSKSQDMNDYVIVDAKLTPQKDKHLLNIDAILNEGVLEPNTTYYYCAYMNDGYSNCYGEIKSFTTKGNAEAYYVWDEASKTATYYYDGMCEIRGGEKIWSDHDVFDTVVRVIFDSSFSNYYPKRFYFYDCTELKSIENMNYLKTDSIENMNYMFRNCHSLTSLDLSGFNTSNVTKMEWMFSGCNSLTSLDLTSFNTSKVTNMGTMFYGCSSLKSLDLSGFNTSNVTSMGNMFSRCSSLTCIDISNFNTSNVTNMAGMFAHCESLDNININFCFTNVETSSAMFCGCSSLKKLELTCNVANKLTDMKEMFAYCKNLVDIKWTIDVDTEKSIDMNWMFSGCSSLEIINLGNVIIKSKGSINMKTMFSACRSLTNISINNVESDCQISLEGMFSGCCALQQIKMKNFNADEIDMSCLLSEEWKENYNLHSLVFSLHDFNAISINATSMFQRCNSLRSIDLSNFDSSNITSMSNMFEWNDSLETITFGNFNTSKVWTMLDMFHNCKSIKILDLTSFNTDNVEWMGGMFQSCSSLKTIYANDWKVLDNFHSSDMFDGCYELEGGQGTKVGRNVYEPGYWEGEWYTPEKAYGCPADSRAAHIDGGKDNPGLFTAK